MPDPITPADKRACLERGRLIVYLCHVPPEGLP